MIAFLYSTAKNVTFSPYIPMITPESLVPCRMDTEGYLYIMRVSDYRAYYCTWIFGSSRLMDTNRLIVTPKFLYFVIERYAVSDCPNAVKQAKAALAKIDNVYKPWDECKLMDDVCYRISTGYIFYTAFKGKILGNIRQYIMEKATSPPHQIEV